MPSFFDDYDTAQDPTSARGNHLPAHTIYFSVFLSIVTFFLFAIILITSSFCSIFCDFTYPDNNVSNDKHILNPCSCKNASVLFEIDHSPNSGDQKNLNTSIPVLDSAHGTSTLSNGNDKQTDDNSNRKTEVVKKNRAYQLHFKGLNILNIHNVTTFDGVDRVLIALTLVLCSLCLMPVIGKSIFSKPHHGEEVYEKLSERLKKAIKGIEESVIPMLAITLTVTFLTNILGKEDNYCEGIGIGIVIAALALYTYLHRGQDNRKSKRVKNKPKRQA